MKTKTYTISVRETLTYEIKISAKNKKHAESIARDMEEDGKLCLLMSDTDPVPSAENFDWTVTED